MTAKLAGLAGALVAAVLVGVGLDRAWLSGSGAVEPTGVRGREVGPVVGGPGPLPGDRPGDSPPPSARGERGPEGGAHSNPSAAPATPAAELTETGKPPAEALPLGPVFPYDPATFSGGIDRNDQFWVLLRARALVALGPNRYVERALKQRAQGLSAFLGEEAWNRVKANLEPEMIRYAEDRHGVLVEHLRALEPLERAKDAGAADKLFFASANAIMGIQHRECDFLLNKLLKLLPKDEHSKLEPYWKFHPGYGVITCQN